MWIVRTIIGLYAIAFVVATIGMNVAFADYPLTTHAGITALIFILTFFACSLSLTSLKTQKKLEEIESELQKNGDER